MIVLPSLAGLTPAVRPAFVRAMANKYEHKSGFVAPKIQRFLTLKCRFNAVETPFVAAQCGHAFFWRRPEPRIVSSRRVVIRCITSCGNECGLSNDDHSICLPTLATALSKRNRTHDFSRKKACWHMCWPHAVIPLRDRLSIKWLGLLLDAAPGTIASPALFFLPLPHRDRTRAFGLTCVTQTGADPAGHCFHWPGGVHRGKRVRGYLA